MGNERDERSSPDGSIDLFNAVASESLIGINYWLYTKKVPINTYSFNKGTAMHAAAQLDEPTILKFIHENGGTVDAINAGIETPLITALRSGKKENAKYLIKAGSPLDTKDFMGRTPLLIACKLEFFELAELMIYRGANVNSEDFSGTPLHCAAYHGNKKFAKLLLERGAELDAKDVGLHRTPLFMAVFHGNYELANYFVNIGANIEQQDRCLLRPLHLAVIGGHPEMITLLLNRNAEIDPIDIGGNTPLHKASQYKHEDCYALLIQKGADYNRRNDLGQRCLMGTTISSIDIVSDYRF